MAAAIDLGSNSFRLLIATPGRPPLNKKMITVGLGRNLAADNRITAAAAEKGVAALAEFRRDIIKAGVTAARTRACGTEALRRAANRNDFIARAENILGKKIEVINGETEARLTLNGIISGLKWPRRPVLIADIGGNSTEIIYASRPPAIDRLVSLGLGAANVSHDLGKGSIDRVTAAIDTAMAGFWSKINPDRLLRLILSGGSATTCAAINLGLDAYDPKQVQGHIITRAEMAAISDRLITTADARATAIKGLDPARAAIVNGGVLLCRKIMEKSAADSVIISDNGLLEGIFLSLAPESVTPYCENFRIE